MKRLVLILLPAFAVANDHNNLEHGRPLTLEDAYSVAFGERNVQGGFGLDFDHGITRYGLMSEFQYGFAKNQDISFSIDAASPHSPTNYGMSYFHNLARELENTPALGYRVGFEQHGNQTRSHLTLAATKAWHQYDKLHVNIGLDSANAPQFVLGYSSPLGYPRVFDRTLVAEAVYQRGVTTLGLGLRKQVDAKSVFDAGIQAGSGATRIVFGFSTSF